MISMSLSEAANRLGVPCRNENTRFTGCSTDSRTVQPGNLFIALRGEKFDGHGFIDKAIEKGASAALVDREVRGTELPLLIVNDTRQAMAKLAASWRNDFAIPVLAVTGSNGKTTVKEMIRAVLGSLRRDRKVLRRRSLAVSRFFLDPTSWALWGSSKIR